MTKGRAQRPMVFKNTITTERLTMKPFDAEDEAPMIALLVNEEIKKTFIIPDFHSTEEAIHMFKKLQRYSYDDAHYERGVYQDNVLIGFVNDVEIEGTTIEIGYVIDPAYHNRGYATEMLRAVINDLFARGFHAIVAGAFETNVASFRVMEKCGMKRIDKEEYINHQNRKQRCLYYSIASK